MNQDGTSLVTSHLLDHSVSSKVDLNQLIEKVADLQLNEYRRRDILLILNLDKEVPRISADGWQIECVLIALFARARNAMTEARKLYGTITARTIVKAGRVQFLLTDEGVGERCPATLGPIFRRRPEEDNDLTVCAEIVQDQGGELYAWRPHHSAATTIVMDFPIDV